MLQRRWPFPCSDSGSIIPGRRADENLDREIGSSSLVWGIFPIISNRVDRGPGGIRKEGKFCCRDGGVSRKAWRKTDALNLGPEGPKDAERRGHGVWDRLSQVWLLVQQGWELSVRRTGCFSALTGRDPVHANRRDARREPQRLLSFLLDI